MSLLILSSGQDKYDSASLMEVDESNLPQSAQVQGLQNPASFSNSIMPTITIPKNTCLFIVMDIILSVRI